MSLAWSQHLSRLAPITKEAGHVEDRTRQRAPGAGPEISTLRKALRRLSLLRGQTYHYDLPKGRGSVIIGPAGRRHVVKTVYGPGMKPPGIFLSHAHVRRAMRKTAEQGGHWRRLKPEQVGHDPGGNERRGATWVHTNRMLRGMKPMPHQKDFARAAEQEIGGRRGGGIIAAHGTGCLDARTVLKVNRGGKTFDITLEELFLKSTGESGSWREDIITKAQCNIGGYLRLNKIVAVYKAGVQEVYEVCAGGNTLISTLGHKFETPEGFQRLGDLEVGDLVLVRGPRGSGGRKSRKPRYSQVKVAAHPYAQVVMHPVSERDRKRCGYKKGHKTPIRRVPKHRLVAEARASGLVYEEFLSRTRSGDHVGLVFLDPKEFAVHHVDRNPKNNSPENLEVLPHSDHFRKHANEGAGLHALETVVASPITSISDAGVSPTYDITMESPHNNYVAEGIVVHNSGKTFGAINAFEKLKGEGKTKRALVITPAGLRDNFLVEGIQKFTSSKGVILNKPAEVSADTEYVVVSYTAFRLRPQEWLDKVKPDTIIADEVHRAANPSGKTYSALMMARKQVPHFMGLTASVVQNKASDVVPLLNLASGGQTDIPSQRSFKKTYVRRRESRQKGVFGGKTYEQKLVRHAMLKAKVGARIHYVEDLDSSRKPAKDVETVDVPMSRQQLSLYRLSMKGVDPTIRKKIAEGQPVSQRHAMNIFTRLMRARQVSNSLQLAVPNMSLEQAAQKTPKIKKILDDAAAHIKNTPDAQVIMYTNIIHGGVDVVEAGLKARGISYGKFVGKGNGVTEASRQQAVKDYQSGKNKVIIITGAGAEGLSLGNTTMVQLVDGHYNPERISQAEARGVRAGGLSHRPREKRRVMVKRYVSALPKTFWQVITFKDPDKSVDQWVYATAAKKSKVNRQVRDILKARSLHEKKKRDSTAYRWFGGGP